MGKCSINKCDRVSYLRGEDDETFCDIHYIDYIENKVDKKVDDYLKKKDYPEDCKYYFISYVYEVGEHYNNWWDCKPIHQDHNWTVIANEHPFTWSRDINEDFFIGYDVSMSNKDLGPDFFHKPYQILNWKEISKEEYRIYLTELFKSVF